MGFYFITTEKNADESDFLFIELKKAFENFIEPIYGDQKKFLEKIRIGEDRKCKLLFLDEQIHGILVYKTKNSDEFKGLGAPKALEIKTLMLIRESKKYSGYMVASLYKEAALAAIENKAKCIVATVSSALNASYNISKKFGFYIAHSWQNKISKNVDEFLICHACPSRLYELTEKYEKLFQKRSKSLMYHHSLMK